MKIYIVSYIVLSDSEYAANGCCEVKAFSAYDEAQAYMKKLAGEEKEYCKSEGREYEMLEDEEREFRISWNSQGEQVRIQIHETEL